MSASVSQGVIAKEPAFRGSAPACAACGSVSAQSGRLFGFPVFRCTSCTHSFIAAREDDLRGFYHDHYAGYRDDPVFASRVREFVTSKLVPRLAPGARVLDVGCGNGEFLLAAKEQDYRVLGIDFSAAAASACEARGLSAVAGDFVSYDFGTRAPFDLISMWDVCEHLARPLEFMQRARQLLRPGGWLLLKVPCYTERAVRLSMAIPKLAGALLGAPEHVQYFQPATLERLLLRVGFTDVRVDTVGALRSAMTHGGPMKAGKRFVIRKLAELCNNANAIVLAR